MIRKALKTDIKELLNLLYQIHDLHLKLRPDLFIPGSKYDEKELEEIIDDENRPIFIYEQDNKVVGYVFLKLYDREATKSVKKRKSVYIDDFCVDENFRNHGIGKTLYEFTFNYAKENGFDDIYLNVWNDNVEAYRFYEKIGFKPRTTIMEKIIK